MGKRGRKSNPDRAATMYSKYTDDGMTLQAIADEYGVSRQNVDSMIRKYGFSMVRHLKVNPSELPTIYERYQAGYTLRAIGKDYGVSSCYLSSLLKKHGYQTGGRVHGYTWTPERLAELQADYDSGLNQTELAAKYNFGQSNISAVMIRYGMRRRNQSDATREGKRRRKAERQAQSGELDTMDVSK